MDALIDEIGCDDIFKIAKGYENRARLNLRAPARADQGWRQTDPAKRANVSLSAVNGRVLSCKLAIALD
ncbi:MAG: hypothetical protein AAF446_01010 [Pseudomonadota bacterium]